MNVIRFIKRIIENILRVRVFGYPWEIMEIIPNKKRHEAWFSQKTILELIIERYKIDLILDVGANVGQMGPAVRRYYKGPIISFEPVSSTYKVLEKNASRDENWFTFNYALGSESGEEYINAHENHQTSSILEKNEFFIERYGEGASKSEKELIQIRRLDDILDEMPLDIKNRKILLKIDTQGYDLEVFRGARSIWDNIFALQSEVCQTPFYHGQPRWLEVINEYEKAGFRIVGLYPIGKDGLYYLTGDCLMVK